MGEGGKAIGPELEWSDFFLGSKGGLKMRSKNVLKKWFRRVPKWTPQSTKIDRKRVLEGSQKETSKMYPLQDQEK